jgi:hypothetical protein
VFHAHDGVDDVPFERVDDAVNTSELPKVIRAAPDTTIEDTVGVAATGFLLSPPHAETQTHTRTSRRRMLDLLAKTRSEITIED